MAENLWLFAAVAVALFLVKYWGLVLSFMALFFVVFVAARAIAPVAVIAAGAFLFPDAASFAGLLDLLVLAILGATISTLVVDWLGLEMVVRRALGGPTPPLHGWSRIGAVFSEGLVTAVSLAAVSHFLDRESLASVSRLFEEPEVLTSITALAPEVELSAGVALVAGLSSAFSFYYLGLCVDNALSGSRDSATSSPAEAEVFRSKDSEKDERPGSRSARRALVLLLVFLLGWASELLAAPVWVGLLLIAAVAVVGAWVFLPLLSREVRS